MDDETVFLVDDDRSMRESLVWMLRSAGIDVEAYTAPHELLKSCDPSRAGCFVLDLRLPEMDGCELRRRLLDRGCRQPHLIISAYGQVPDVVEAMREGAVDFLEKPFDHKVFLNRVRGALALDAETRQNQAEKESVDKRLRSLTNREREVLDLVVQGMLSKQIARTLDISPKTVDVHRSRVTRKMGVASVAQLVQLMVRFDPAGHSSNAAAASPRQERAAS